MNKKQFVCFTLILSLFFLTGCWDRRELKDLAIVLGWGIDQAQNKDIQVSAQVIIPSKISGGQSDGGRESQGKSYFVVTGTGKNTLDAVQQMQTKLSRQAFLGHRRIIVIGEPMARQGIKDVLDTYTRDPNLKLRTDIFVIKGSTAKDFLKVSYPLESIPAIGALKEYDQQGALKEMAFLNFLMSASSEGSGPSLPAVAITQSSSSQDDSAESTGFRIVGTAIFNKDLKLIGILNTDEGRTLRWVTGNLNKRTITAVLPQGAGNVSLDVNKMESRILPVVQGNKIRIQVMLTGQGMIRENNTNLDLTQTKNITLLQNALDKQVEESVLKTITMVQKEYGTDVFEFGETIHRKNPSRWNSLKKNWDKEFQKARVYVKVDLMVRRIGLTGPSLQLKEDEIKK